MAWVIWAALHLRQLILSKYTGALYFTSCAPHTSGARRRNVVISTSIVPADTDAEQCGDAQYALPGVSISFLLSIKRCSHHVDLPGYPAPSQLRYLINPTHSNANCVYNTLPRRASLSLSKMCDHILCLSQLTTSLFIMAGMSRKHY